MQLKSVLHSVDSVNEWVGKAVAVLIIPMTIITVIEVTLRYVFSRPTIWVWDMNLMMMGAFTILPGGYVFLSGGHVIIDLCVGRLTPKRRAVIDLFTSVLLFIGVGCLVWQSGVAAVDSLHTKEIVNSVWGPPLYPLKILWPIGAFLLIVQGVAKFIRDLATVCSREIRDR